MAEETEQLSTHSYKIGDKIRIELEVSDESGVDHVEAYFTHEGATAASLTFLGYGEGREEATIILEQEVTEDVVPGEYTCFYLLLVDCRNNTRTISRPSGLRFRVEGIPGDHEGPELRNSQMLPAE